MGPRTVPCGTPEVTAAVNDLLPSRTTSWVRIIMDYHWWCCTKSWHRDYPVCDSGRKATSCRFFSAKLRGRQGTWLQCQVEAFSIAVATKHFNPNIIQSKDMVCILTDSKPCALAFEKIHRGECSASQRVSTYLPCVSR